MKTSPLLRCLVAALALVPALASSVRADLIISEMCDPRLNFRNDRFIEIYNSGASPVSLTGWSLIAVANTVEVFTWSLSGSIQPGEALVCGDATTTVSFPVDFPQEGWSDANMNWNGGNARDGAKLKNGPTVVDDSVVPSALFTDQTYVRNSNITTGSPSFVQSQWTGTAVDFPTQATPGTHNQASAPVISNIVISPSLPLPADSVQVSADVVDTTSAIASVTLRWGTTAGSHPNAISMALLSGSTYRTVSKIPPQSSGTAVYYVVEAVNAATGTATSPEQSYGIPTVLTIYQIQGQTASSPYAGQTVITSGVVTAIYGTTFVIQNGTGIWNGIWVQGASASSGDTVTVRGAVSEASGNTTITGVQILNSASGGTIPAYGTPTTVQAAAESYEGVLVSIVDADCTDPDLGTGEWQVDDGSGSLVVGVLGYPFSPTLGTTYTVRGPVTYTGGRFQLEPRNASDVTFTGDTAAPVIFATVAESQTSVRVTFSETVDEPSAEITSHYTVSGSSVSAAVRNNGSPDEVVLTVSSLSSGTHVLTVNLVQDQFGNATSNVQDQFSYSANNIPPGYYDPAAGLWGTALRQALHNIIDNHTVRSYTYAWTAFQTTDDKANGKVWDMYSDVPGGTPAYEYTFVTDQCGNGSGEGDCYNREHSWPNSWFGGSVSPMYSDLFMLYPTDYEVNNRRGSFPYGEVNAPTWTSTNGGKLGPCVTPGYSGTVFEPIDTYKGDFARTYLYTSTRYYTEDGAWPGSAMTDGCDVLPWALTLLLEWHEQDPVSAKEIERNITVYGFQGNRNPYIDHPEYAERVFGNVVAVPEPGTTLSITLSSAPNPFHSSTDFRFDLPAAAEGRLAVYDVAGRQVAVLAAGPFQAGPHAASWDGRGADGRAVGSGIYYGVLTTGNLSVSRPVVLLR